MRPQVVGHLLGQLAGRVLGHLVERVPVWAVQHPGDVDDQPRACLDHHGRCQPRRIGGGAEPAGEHQVPVPPLDLPEPQRWVRRNLIPAPGVVDQQVQPPLLSADAAKYRAHLSIVGVITADRDPCAAAAGDLLGGLLDRARPAQCRRLAADASPGDKDRPAVFAENQRDSLAAAPAGASDQRNLVPVGTHRHLPSPPFTHLGQATDVAGPDMPPPVSASPAVGRTVSPAEDERRALTRQNLSGIVLDVRASRLVTLLLLLQARGQMTAAELAGELEVSVRTIQRDIEALSAAGVPVYSERGRDGGYRLVDGYRSRLTGLDREEVQALITIGAAGTARELGLGQALMSARLKLAASLPTEISQEISAAAGRFHLDARGWFTGRT